jgi:toxin HigB-1
VINKKVSVRWNNYIAKNINNLPSHIQLKFMTWVKLIESDGLENMRINPGFHDELLKGKRKGQRSVRLNRAYRVIYEISKSQELSIIKVIGVSKHEY